MVSSGKTRANSEMHMEHLLIRATNKGTASALHGPSKNLLTNPQEHEDPIQSHQIGID